MSRRIAVSIASATAAVVAVCAPLAAQQLTSLAVGSPGAVGVPVAMTVEGEPACGFTVDFGDGQTATFAAPMPQRFTHPYPRAGSYTVVATAAAPCTGRMTLPLEVGPEDLPGRLRGIKVSASIEHGTTNVTARMVVLGSGRCGYTIDFGDGTSERRTQALPDLVTHTYSVPKNYAIVATAQAPCDGLAKGGVNLIVK